MREAQAAALIEGERIRLDKEIIEKRRQTIELEHLQRMEEERIRLD